MSIVELQVNELWSLVYLSCEDTRNTQKDKTLPHKATPGLFSPLSHILSVSVGAGIGPEGAPILPSAFATLDTFVEAASFQDEG